jgi:hypothetical protein
MIALLIRSENIDLCGPFKLSHDQNIFLPILKSYIATVNWSPQEMLALHRILKNVYTFTVGLEYERVEP